VYGNFFLPMPFATVHLYKANDFASFLPMPLLS